MIDAKLLATYDAESGEVLYLLGGWFPRKGDNLRLTMEVVHNYFAAWVRRWGGRSFPARLAEPTASQLWRQCSPVGLWRGIRGEANWLEIISVR